MKKWKVGLVMGSSADTRIVEASFVSIRDGALVFEVADNVRCEAILIIAAGLWSLCEEQK